MCRRPLLHSVIFTISPTITLLCSALVCFADLRGLLVRRCVVTGARLWGSRQVSLRVLRGGGSLGESRALMGRWEECQ